MYKHIFGIFHVPIVIFFNIMLLPFILFFSKKTYIHPTHTYEDLNKCMKKCFPNNEQKNTKKNRRKMWTEVRYHSMRVFLCVCVWISAKGSAMEWDSQFFLLFVIDLEAQGNYNTFAFFYIQHKKATFTRAWFFLVFSLIFTFEFFLYFLFTPNEFLNDSPLLLTSLLHMDKND